MVNALENQPASSDKLKFHGTTMSLVWWDFQLVPPEAEDYWEKQQWSISMDK